MNIKLVNEEGKKRMVAVGFNSQALSNGLNMLTSTNTGTLLSICLVSFLLIFLFGLFAPIIGGIWLVVECSRLNKKHIQKLLDEGYKPATEDGEDILEMNGFDF